MNGIQSEEVVEPTFTNAAVNLNSCDLVAASINNAIGISDDNAAVPVNALVEEVVGENSSLCDEVRFLMVIGLH